MNKKKYFDTYNKIMIFFWLTLGLAIIVAVTIMGFREGFEKWSFYYVLGFLSLFAFAARIFVIRRVKKNQEKFMKDQK